MPRVCLLWFLPCLTLVVLSLPVGQAADVDDAATADEKLLRDNGVAADGPGVLAFLRERSLSEEERGQMATLVRQLGDNSFDQREAATRKLVLRGPVAVPFLKAALNDPDAEIAHRARSCLGRLSGGPGPGLPSAAIRQLVRKRPGGAIEMMLRYVAFADDDSVVDECHQALRVLGLHDGKAGDAVLAALREKETMRRAAAAYVVAAAADNEQREKAVPLLRDAAPFVRFCAVQGLLAARDPRGVPVLIDLLDGPSEITWRAEDLLLRLAGEKGPRLTLTTDDERKKARAAWAAWWQENQRTVDLAKIDSAPAFLNLTLVCEMHGSKIWEVDQAGKVRWTMDKLNRPRDAQILPGGRVLITEVNDNKIREREIATGKVLWEHSITDPSFVRRLPNGNTFVANHSLCYEVLDDMESFAIETSEFEVECRSNEENSLVVTVAALFRESPEAGLEGWFIWKYVSVSKKNLVYCRGSPIEATAAYMHVLLCGCPEKIHPRAILTKTEVMELLSSLMDGTATSGFDWRPFPSVVVMAE